MNLPQQLQEYLKFPALQVIDPNNGLPADETKFDALCQSALVTFLAGLYKSTRTKEGAAEIKTKTKAEDLLNAIFVTKQDVLNTIADFSKEPAAVVEEKMIVVARGWIAFANLQIPADQTQPDDYLQGTMSAQRNEILKYLPGGLKLGDLLNDEALDDNTNQMQGPISTLMHKIENAFSTSG